MASTVQNIVKDAVGNVIAGAVVTIDLVILDGSGGYGSVQGFHPSTQNTIDTPAQVITNNLGVWSISGVPGNDEIEDAGGNANTTHWRISEAASGVTRSYFIRFGTSAPGTIWAGDYTDNNAVFVPATYTSATSLGSPLSITMSAALTRTNIGASLDLSYATEIKLDCRVRTSAAGLLLLQYSTDNTAWFTLGSIDTSSSGMKTTDYISIPGGVRTNSYWQLATNSGTAGTAAVDFATLIYR